MRRVEGAWGFKDVDEADDYMGERGTSEDPLCGRPHFPYGPMSALGYCSVTSARFHNRRRSPFPLRQHGSR